MSARILLVSADQSWREVFGRLAASLSHRLDSVRTAAEGWKAVEEGRADLLVLDVELPSLERLGWFKLLRGSDFGRGVPAILAGASADEREIAEAFDHDADDFVLKDCEPSELAARVGAVLRRKSGAARRPERPLRAGAMLLDTARHQCLVRRTPVPLNPREFQLLEALMRRPGRVLSRDYLLEAIWGMSASARTRAVDVAVSRLRKALGRRAGRWIETIERYGYRLRDPRRLAR